AWRFRGIAADRNVRAPGLVAENDSNLTAPTIFLLKLSKGRVWGGRAIDSLLYRQQSAPWPGPISGGDGSSKRGCRGGRQSRNGSRFRHRKWVSCGCGRNPG